MKYYNNLKTSIALLLVIILLTGCNKATDSTKEQKFAWPLATSSPEDTVTQIFAEKFAEEVYRLSDGTMKIQVYANGTLGGDRELLESCAGGDIPFVIQNTAPQVSFMPKIAVFDLPCAFESIEELRKAVDNEEFNRKISQVYKDGGYHLLGFADQGFRVMSTNKKINILKDFKGQKIRTMENSYHLSFWKSIGANPTPMTFNEVYIGLQQGTIDAQENPYEVIVSSKLYEQQDYVVETNHLPHLISLIVSDEFYENLSPIQQEVIDEAATIAKEYAREQSDLRIEERMKKIEESGTEIVEVSDELREEIRNAAKPVYEKISNAVGNDLVDIFIGENENP